MKRLMVAAAVAAMGVTALSPAIARAAKGDNCKASLAACESDLSTCNSNYGTCSRSLAMLNNDYTACNSELATCNDDLAALSCITTCGTGVACATTCDSGGSCAITCGPGGLCSVDAGCFAGDFCCSPYEHHFGACPSGGSGVCAPQATAADATSCDRSAICAPTLADQTTLPSPSCCCVNLNGGTLGGVCTDGNYCTSSPPNGQGSICMP